MIRLPLLAPVIAFWVIVSAFSLHEGRTVLAGPTGLALLASAWLAGHWVQARQLARTERLGPGAGVDAPPRPPLRDIAIATLAVSACCALALWGWLSF
ncbi:hypothetical protein ACI2IY_02890 [Lysobacter enzymogenes]|uniref:hypothetical protein n=1 Tax=Lysobacter enzymogenes TaxID=69 RepID=UPI00384E289F